MYADKAVWLKSLVGALPGGPWHVRTRNLEPGAEVLAGTKLVAAANSADVADAIAELPDLLANADREDLAAKLSDLKDLAEDMLRALRKAASKGYSREQRETDADQFEERLDNIL